MGREDDWEKLLDNDPGYEAWRRQEELEQQEQEELDQDGEKKTES